LRDQTKRTIWESLKNAMEVYRSRGYRTEEFKFTEYNKPIHTIVTDDKFKTLREKVEGCGVQVNIATIIEHVSEVIE
jgi:hypothetical protein